MSRTVDYIDAPRPKAYLLVYSQCKAGGLLRNELRISGSCYPISLPQLDVAQRIVKHEESIDYDVIPNAVEDGYDIITARRAKVAHELVRACAAVAEPQDCVLIPRKRWDAMQKELKFRRKAARTWKWLAKKYFGVLRFIA